MRSVIELLATLPTKIVITLLWAVILLDTGQTRKLFQVIVAMSAVIDLLPVNLPGPQDHCSKQSAGTTLHTCSTQTQQDVHLWCSLQGEPTSKESSPCHRQLICNPACHCKLMPQAWLGNSSKQQHRPGKEGMSNSCPAGSDASPASSPADCNPSRSHSPVLLSSAPAAFGMLLRW